MKKCARRFSDEERKVLLENWWDINRRDEICKRYGRTEGSFSFEYYRLLRELGISPMEHRMKMQSIGSEHSQEFLARQFETMAFLLKQKEPIDISALLKEVCELREQCSLLNAQLAEERENNRRVVEEIDANLNQFFGLTSIEKLSTLRDFLPRMKTVVDKYGMVVSAHREGSIQDYLIASTSN